MSALGEYLYTWEGGVGACYLFALHNGADISTSKHGKINVWYYAVVGWMIVNLSKVGTASQEVGLSCLVKTDAICGGITNNWSITNVDAVLLSETDLNKNKLK